MRRMWAAGAAVMICLLVGAPAASQQASGEPSPSPAPGSSTLVTWTFSDCATEAGTSAYVDGINQVRGMTETCIVTAGDPRLRGTSTNHINWDQPAAGYVEWGTLEFTGPDGTWVGPWVGPDPDVVWVAQGSGAYAGWTLVAHIVVGSSDPANGILYYGPPPAWAPVVADSPAPAG